MPRTLNLFALRNVIAVSTSVVLSTFACGGSSSSGMVAGGDAGDGGTPATQPPAEDAGTGTETSTTADSAPPKADAAPIDTRLDPIEVGRAWTYNVEVLGIYPSCENGLGTATTVSKSSKDGKTAFKVQSLCKDSGTFEYAVENDRVFYYHLGGWRLATDEPVKVGHTWSDGTYDYVWEDAGTMTVAAGTFTNCWTARRVLPYDSFTTFCRGVGPVHWHFEDGFGNGYDALLASKNF
jgi:hypothetical protein